MALRVLLYANICLQIPCGIYCVPALRIFADHRPGKPVRTLTDALMSAVAMFCCNRPRCSPLTKRAAKAI